MSEDRLDQLDYYTLLRIEPDVGPDAIRAAFHDFALRYHPDRFATAGEAKRERAAQIYRRGAEAYRVLMDLQSRRAYDRGLAKGRVRMSPEQERRSSIPAPRAEVSSPRARPFATKAQQALAAGDLKTAKLNLKMALSHDPANEALEARLAEVEEKLRRR